MNEENTNLMPYLTISSRVGHRLSVGPFANGDSIESFLFFWGHGGGTDINDLGSGL